MSYSGPKNIVVLGGGIAGLAAADAITRALDEHPGPLPTGITVTLVEAESSLGGRASSRPLDAAAHVDHPHAPWGTQTPHGLHFVWGSYAHLLRLVDGVPNLLSPAVGTSTYCAWMAPPDIPGGANDGGRVVAVHVCDPTRPQDAWQPRAQRVLAAFARRGPAIDAFERAIKSLLDLPLEVSDLLSYMDIVFDEENLGTELRWILFLTGALSGALGYPETSPILTRLLGGRRPADVDIGELMRPLFFEHALPRLRRAASFAPLVSLRGAVEMGFDVTARVVDILKSLAPGAASGLKTSTEDLRALAEFFLLLATDSVAIVSRALTYDPRSSGYLKNILKAAFSSPYGLDVATSMRDAQFGVRRYEGAVLQLFDGDDSRAAWEAIGARIEARFSSGKFGGALVRRQVAKRLVVSGGKVTAVELADPPAGPPAEVPTVAPRTPGAVTTTLPADVVVSTLLPQCVAPLLRDEPSAEPLVRTMTQLSSFMNETINLQLFFPDKHELPFPPVPPASIETPPFGISNLEGPFTIVVDLRRGWSKARFEAIALDEPALGTPFDGTAWELVGAYSDFFTHDGFAHGERYQWPLAVQQKLAAIGCDPDDLLAETLDKRAWLHDSNVPGRLDPPPMGEVRADRALAYSARWRSEAVPLIVATTLEQLAAMPNMAERTRNYLYAQAGRLLRGDPIAMRYAFVRNAQAAVRFFSAEPELFGSRPHARFETAEVGGLYLSGDWTRNGLNLQAMEAATIAGLQSAYGVLEAMRGGGLEGLVPPKIDPDIVPVGAWDVGYPAP
ncbi:MAG: NAD(P)-binding protein [Polyangiaceae bacterium]|nr:NAD(P)-binding protein [Polyangiaceae bacterium]